jgi:hypothetical protein
MYRLTERRLASAQPILEKHRAELFQRHSFDAQSLERELRDTWRLGYRELKGIMRDMLKHERYREVAAYYMEHSSARGVVSEFQQPLASLYGIKSYHAPERKEMRSKFWARVFGGTEA